MSRSDRKSLGIQDLANGAITNVVASDTRTMCNRSRMFDQKCLHIKMPCFALSLSSAAVLLLPLFFLFFFFFENHTSTCTRSKMIDWMICL